MQFLDIILLAAIAAFLILRLRNTLGQHNDDTDERERNDLFYKSRSQKGEQQDPEAEDNLIRFPGQQERPEAPRETSDYDQEDQPDPDFPGYATQKAERKLQEDDSPLGLTLRKMHDVDPNFIPETFLEGAKMAYEMVVVAFAQGDKATLRNLLARDVYDAFVGAIDQRTARDERMELEFIGFQSAEISDADFDGQTAEVAVRFEAESLRATYDRSGDLVDGDPQAVNTAVDTWTFTRNMNSSDPNWTLTKTRSGS